MQFEVLHPGLSSYQRAMKDNDRSCVLKISAAGGTVLVTGDIERRSEEALVSEGAPLGADVLVAPHQGSNTSSTRAFVDAVRPQSVIFPVGYRNRFGHPHAAVVERYRQLGSTLYRTDSDGAVLIAIGRDKPIEISRYRAVYRRYWLDAPAHDASALDAQLGRAW